jgi:hypothetical protein
MITVMGGGILSDSSQLTVALPLTPQEQQALSRSISHGVCLLRVRTGLKHGSATFRVTGIKMSFYDPWNSAEASSGPIYCTHTFASPLTVSVANTESNMIDLSAIKELGVFPTLLELVVDTVTLDNSNFFEGVHCGIMMGAAIL